MALDNINLDDSQSADESQPIYGGRILLEKRIQELQNSLANRNRMPFDPVWMKIASGLLQPTKTGGFGESLGYAAAGASEAAEKELARKTDVEKLQLELAAKQYQLAQEAQGQKMLLGAMGMGKGQAPAGGETLAAGEPAETKDGLSSNQVAGMVAKNPNIMDQITMTPERVAAITAVSPAYGKIAESIYKGQLDRATLEQKRYSFNQLGDKIDTFTGQVVEQGVRSVDVESPFERGVVMKMPARYVNEYNAIDQNDTAAVNKFLRSHGLGAYAVGKTDSGTPVAEKGKAAAETPMTKQQQELQSEELKGEYAGTSPAGKAIGALSDAAQTATDVKNMANESIELAKSNPNAFKLLMNKDVRSWLDAALAAAKQGVGTPWGSFNLPTDIIAKYDLPMNDVMALQKFAQTEALFSMMNRRTWLKGEGSVSNAEGASAALLGPQAYDRPEVIRMKSEAIARKAQFEEDTFNAYSNWKDAHPMGTWRRFLTSEDFNGIKSNYVKDMNRMNKSNSQFFSGKAPAKSSAPAAPAQGGSLYQKILEEGEQ